MPERGWRKGNSCTVGGNVSCCNHYGKQYGGSSENGKPCDPAILLLDILAKQYMYLHRALFTMARTRKQCNYPSTGEWTKQMYIYTVEYYSAIKNRSNAVAAMWMHLERLSY